MPVKNRRLEPYASHSGGATKLLKGSAHTVRARLCPTHSLWIILCQYLGVDGVPKAMWCPAVQHAMLRKNIGPLLNCCSSNCGSRSVSSTVRSASHPAGNTVYPLCRVLGLGPGRNLYRLGHIVSLHGENRLTSIPSGAQLLHPVDPGYLPALLAGARCSSHGPGKWPHGLSACMKSRSSRYHWSLGNS